MLNICINAIATNENEIQRAAEKAIIATAACAGLFTSSSSVIFVCKMFISYILFILLLHFFPCNLILFIYNIFLIYLFNI